MTASPGSAVQSKSTVRLLGLLDPIARPVLLLLVTAVDRILTPIQRRVGIDRMGYFFVLPNLIIFGVFVLFPMLLNFYYAMTGGTKLFPADRPFVGLGNFETLFDCEDFLSPNSCQEDLFWRGIFNTIQYVILQVSGIVMFSLATALVLNRRIVARGFFRSVFFYPVLLSPVVVALIWKWVLQHEGVLNAIIEILGGESETLAARYQLGDVLGGFRQRLGADGILHPDIAGGLAIDTARVIRGEFDRRRKYLAGLPLRHPAPSDADDVCGACAFADSRGADVRSYLRIDRWRTGYANPVDGAVYLYNRLFQPDSTLRIIGGGLNGAGRFAADIDPAAIAARQPVEPVLGSWAMAADRISISKYLSLRSGGARMNTSDALTYLYLTVGTILMFGPVLWLVFSSFKTQAGLVKYPPPLLPYQQVQVEVEGYDKPLPLFTVAIWTMGASRELAQVRRVGIEAQMVDPANPSADVIKVNIRQREAVEEVRLAWENYLDPLVELENFDFFTYLKNSVVVTTTATVITLLINSMAAFALSKYKFQRA